LGQAAAQSAFGVTQSGTDLVSLANGGGVRISVGAGTSTMPVNHPTVISRGDLDNPADFDWYTARVTYDSATGDWIGYLSDDTGPDASWTQVRSGTAAAQVPFVFSTAVMRVGSGPVANIQPCAYSWLEIRPFDSDTIVAAVDFRSVWMTRNVTDVAGNVWNLNGTQWSWITV
jgi:hypothetical protein